tara:strand:- start:301 stop:1173 length:873 start_codon:yes stop_codon:yes gene_type:complete
MEKFIIIDTWNGEGYTESKAEIMEFKDRESAKEYCLVSAKEQAKSMKTECYEIKQEDKVIGYGYTDEEEEDAGAYMFEVFEKEIVGVVLNPCVNDCVVMRTTRDFDDAVSFAHRNGSEDDETMDALERGEDGLFIHNGGLDGDAMFFRFDTEQDTMENSEKETIVVIPVDERYSEGTVTERKNKLIAEFLIGNQPVSFKVDDSYDLFGVTELGDVFCDTNEDDQHYFSPKEMKFHSSWDWLMPVIRKCKEEQIFGSQKLIDYIDFSLLSTQEEHAFNSVVKFIQFYNENK